MICGYDELARLTLETLMQFGQTALVIDRQVPEEPLEGCQFVQGDFRNRRTLHQIGVESARVVMLLRADDQENFETALLVRDLNPQARIISRLFNRNLAHHFDRQIPNHFSLSTSALSSPAFGLKAVSDEFIGYFTLPCPPTPAPTDSDPTAPTSGDRPPSTDQEADTSLWNIVDLTLGSESRLVHLPLEELEERFHVRVLFHYPVDQLADFSPVRTFEDFDHGAKLALGDRLVLICGPDRYQQLLERNGQRGDSRAQRWATQTQTSAPTAPSLSSQIGKLLSLPLRLTPLSRFLASTLAVLIGLGILIFQLLDRNTADALFLTITLLNGGYGDIGEFQQEQTHVLAKLVGVLLTLVGTLLVGLLYGIVTDKLLSSRFGLGQAAVVPRSGHVIIAHLGRLGYRILQLLRQMKYEVVVVEPDETNPLIEAARQEGVAVVVGDCSLPSTLSQVNVEQSRCLICCLTADLANVETALTAQTLNPELRTILRISDPVLAERMQRHFHQLGISYSPASISAPAFATAALVGKVYGTVFWANQVLLVTRLEISPRSPQLGLSLYELGYRYDLVILVWQPQAQPEVIFPKSWDQSGQTSISVGDQITILGTLASLSRLARHQPLSPEAYRVKLVQLTNPYFESEVIEAIAFYSRQPPERIRPLLQRLPQIVSPRLSRDKALKLAQQLRKMTAQVQVIGEVVSPRSSHSSRSNSGNPSNQ